MPKLSFLLAIVGLTHTVSLTLMLEKILHFSGSFKFLHNSKNAKEVMASMCLEFQTDAPFSGTLQGVLFLIDFFFKWV